MPKKTWNDIREKALHCPFLYQLVALDGSGMVTREDALIHVVLALSDAQARLLDDNVRLMKRLPAAQPIVIGEGTRR